MTAVVPLLTIKTRSVLLPLTVSPGRRQPSTVTFLPSVSGARGQRDGLAAKGGRKGHRAADADTAERLAQRTRTGIGGAW